MIKDSPRYLGIDLGSETIKIAELKREDQCLRWTGSWIAEHHKEPIGALQRLLGDIGWEISGAAATGRFSRHLALERIPVKEAQSAGFRFLHGSPAGTIVSIGGHGFSVLELRASGAEIFRENNRCSQGTGNFLRQLVQRFDLGISEASALCDDVADPAPLSGRCPVILKTDMTHLANKGESRARILAGLFDAVCENVQALIKQSSPPEVMLAGGVSRSPRVRRQLARFVASRGGKLFEYDEKESLFLEAVGCAWLAATRELAAPVRTQLFRPSEAVTLDRVPSLAEWSPQVRRLTRPALPSPNGNRARVLLGFDIGSTGSKLVALHAESAEPVWEGYVQTGGNPVGAAQDLVRRFLSGPAAGAAVVACGVTGSGREIAGSLLATCYGVERVFVLNEIAAHAEGALHYDPRVDTIFEIGGQDAKYIRLADGRVVDAAMNEACSAGTGSFIEEQGRRFSDVDGVESLGRTALASPHGVSLGQHCSVFMAEVIDEAVAAGIEQQAIIAGLYDSIVQNYLNRVKGSRSVGEFVFCQGMPFSADALAAAVARQTGSEVIVPPSPGTVGALGIALLARRAIPLDRGGALDLDRFLRAQVTRKDTLVCKSSRGCGGGGNRCRIDRVATLVEQKSQRFTWGGACSLWDKGSGKRKLPDRAPDPFRSRSERIGALIERLSVRRGRPLIGITDEFHLKTLFPLFATFLFDLGFDLLVRRGADQAVLKRGVEGANVPFCAPMQQFHGLVACMVEDRPDFLFLPLLRSVERSAGEPHSAVCPVVQGSPDVLRWDLGKVDSPQVLSPVIDMGGENLHSPELRASCENLARTLGRHTRWERSYQSAVQAQELFDRECLELGRQALAYCGEQGIVPVVILGRSYTIHNKVLNSNVPAIVREQGAIAIPVDCYPLDGETPVFEHVYWGYGQRNLRAAHQIRRSPGVYSIWCSNYSCGPDSFNLHFYSYIMQGRPFAVIETDGHSGDAGTKTRVEAFLHCVGQDLNGARSAAPSDFRALEQATTRPTDMRARQETVLIPRLGPGAEVLASVLNGLGMRAESLPLPDREAMHIGRRYTSGKECVPMCITLGSLVQRLEREGAAGTRFAFLMPRTAGPCRFGVYNLLHKLVVERLGWSDRVRVWTPVESDYGEELPSGTFALAVAGWNAVDVLLQGLHDVRPVESSAGAAQTVFDRHMADLLERMRIEASREPTWKRALREAATGRLFGCREICRSAARSYAAVKSARRIPTVAVVGEIYVRCDPFANDFVIEKLERRGIRARLAPFNEWLEYADWCHWDRREKGGIGGHLSTAVLKRSQELCYAPMARQLGWHPRTTVQQSLAASAPYLRSALYGEAVLTLGTALHEWRQHAIDGVVNVGPLECMPTKLAETQFLHAAEREGLPSVTIPFNGDPLDPEILDNFVFEVHSRFRQPTALRRQGTAVRS